MITAIISITPKYTALKFGWPDGWILCGKNTRFSIPLMGCITLLFVGIAVVFYLEAALAKGTVMLILALLILAFLVYSLRQDRKPARRSWNSWFDKRH